MGDVTEARHLLTTFESPCTATNLAPMIRRLKTRYAHYTGNQFRQKPAQTRRSSSNSHGSVTLLETTLPLTASRSRLRTIKSLISCRPLDKCNIASKIQRRLLPVLGGSVAREEGVKMMMMMMMKMRHEAFYIR